MQDVAYSKVGNLDRLEKSIRCCCGRILGKKTHLKMKKNLVLTKSMLFSSNFNITLTISKHKLEKVNMFFF